MGPVLLIALPLGGGGQLLDFWLHLLPRVGFSAELLLVLTRVGYGNATPCPPILALETLAPSPGSALYKISNIPTCLFHCEMGMA